MMVGHSQTAIVLAGGLGTRLRSAVADVPKPMALISGRPFLEHQLEYWVNQGVKKFVLSVGYMSDVIISHFGASWRGADIDYAIEQEPLGTGGGLLSACQKLDTDMPFLLLNGDSFFAVSLNSILQLHHVENADMTIALFPANESGRYGKAEFNSGSRLVSLASDIASKGEYANGGIYYFSKSLLSPWANLGSRKISFESEILPELLSSDKHFVGLKSTMPFIDIGIPEDWRRAADILLEYQSMPPLTKTDPIEKAQQ